MLALLLLPACGYDGDRDGYTVSEDCNDLTSLVYPGADEVCNGRDDNCDGEIDEGTECYDGDGDGYPVAYDCDDTDATINPGADEVCADSTDNDCDGSIDETTPFYQDLDGDGYGDPDEVTEEHCQPPEGFVESSTDCDDSDSNVHPSADEPYWDCNLYEGWESLLYLHRGAEKGARNCSLVWDVSGEAIDYPEDTEWDSFDCHDCEFLFDVTYTLQKGDHIYDDGTCTGLSLDGVYGYHSDFYDYGPSLVYGYNHTYYWGGYGDLDGQTFTYWYGYIDYPFEGYYWTDYRYGLVEVMFVQ